MAKPKPLIKDSTTEIYETDDGTIIGITKDNTIKDYYTVTVRKPNQKAETVATRCTYMTAINIAKECANKTQKGN